MVLPWSLRFIPRTLTQDEVVILPQVARAGFVPAFTH
jgi:hypothetical protein